jgi:hypothetical protein
MSFSLTADAIANMFHGQQQGRPMLQVLHIKEVKKQDAMRYMLSPFWTENTSPQP